MIRGPDPQDKPRLRLAYVMDVMNAMDAMDAMDAMYVVYARICVWMYAVDVI